MKIKITNLQIFFDLVLIDKKIYIIIKSFLFSPYCKNLSTYKFDNCP